MRGKVLSLVGAAALLVLAGGRLHAQDAICPTPTEIAGFRTCADVAKAEQEGKLVIYSTDVEQGTAKILAAFGASFPKIKPSYVRALSASLYAKLQSERQAGQYLADLVNVDVVLASDFLKRNGYARYVSPQMAAFRSEFKSKPEGYFTWAQLAPAAIAYNPKFLPADQAPKTWDDILNPKYAGTMNVKSSNSGVQHFVWYTVREVMGKDFWKGLAGQKPKAFDSYVQQYDRIVNGEDKIVIGAQYSGYLEFKAKGAPLEFVFPDKGVPASPQVWGIIDKAPNPQAARLFLDWFLSPVGQKAMQEALFLNSPRNDAVPPPGGVPASQHKLLFPDDWSGFLGSKREFNAEWDRVTGLK
jgi:iron(III) transport system substrate-binding protein